MPGFSYSYLYSRIDNERVFKTSYMSFKEMEYLYYLFTKQHFRTRQICSISSIDIL